MKSAFRTGFIVTSGITASHLFVSWSKPLKDV
jgi:hypothetical protein